MPRQVQQMRQQQPGRARPDDPHLRAHGAPPASATRMCRLSPRASARVCADTRLAGGEWRGMRRRESGVASAGPARPAQREDGPMSRRMLYDLAGADPALRFSPFCWRIRMALAHKGLDGRDHPLALHREGPHRLRRPGAGAGAGGWGPDPARQLGHRRIPRGRLSAPSQPVRRAATAQAVTRFVNGWTDASCIPGSPGWWCGTSWTAWRRRMPAISAKAGRSASAPRWRSSSPTREANLPAFRRELQPLRLALRGQPFLSGEAPAYADYIVFGAFSGPARSAPSGCWRPDDPVHAWRGRMLGLFDGLAAGAGARSLGSLRRGNASRPEDQETAR